MITRCFLYILSVFFVTISAQQENEINKVHEPSPILKIAMAEHQLSQALTPDYDNQSWQTTTERTLIRVTRLHDRTKSPKSEKRARRQIIEAIQTADVVISVAKAIRDPESSEKILGMAKKIAITVIVVCSLCIAFCLIATVVVCIKCFRRGNGRKRSQGPTTAQVPQPIYVHTSPAGYQPQGWTSAPMQSPEGRPMLPKPSAPPRPNDSFHTEQPPPAYEKLYTGK